MLQAIQIFGVKIHRVTMDQAVDAVTGFLHEGGPHQVITADSSMLVMARRDEELRRTINDAALVTPDSFGVTWAARRLGRPLPERVTGVDLAERLCRRCASAGRRVFFLGAAPGVAEEAAARMAGRYPGLHVVGTRHGFFRAEEEEGIVAEIAASGAELLLVALGIPRQEKWIARHLSRLGVSAAIGVGGTLDVFSGRVARAPAWAQRGNVEWLYRLARNPRKIQKVKTLPVLVWMTLAAMARSDGG
ncbi:MAG: WecB/TagA/CpsF family glycosyltransferase [Armatimonadetes bacterium]|nr:WecB/TagA/CpsF family glycosyltransferase [Armatimonadota bacterium]